jgi:hypothetical protein
VDRYLFVEVLKRVLKLRPPNGRYTYVGFGGPFLEDLKVIDHYFPEMRLTSLECDEETFKRQRFHQFCRGVRIWPKTDRAFVSEMKEDELITAWFDYLGREPENFGVFGDLLKRAANWSVLRVTLNASFKDDAKFREEFSKRFDQILPADYETYFENEESFLILLQKMIRAVTTPQLRTGHDFRLLSSATYRDGARMLTVTGLKCPDVDWKRVHKEFSRWPFFTPSWNSKPTRIDVPELSVQERVRLGRYLPSSGEKVGHRLHRKLGYSIAGSSEASARDLANYAAFSRYFPIFARLAF